MLRLLGALCFLILFLTACQSGNSDKEEDDFPTFSDEQLQQMMQRQNPMMGQTPQQTSLPNMIAQMEASAMQFPDDTTMWYNLAKLTYQQYMADSSAEYLDKTIVYYSKVLELDPNYEEGRPHYNRLLAELDKGQYEAALKDLEAFKQINQGRIRLNDRATRAEILFQQGKLEAACAVYQEAKTIAVRDSLPTGNEAIWQERCP